MRRRELDILYVATRAALLFLLPLYVSDTGLYQDYARNFYPGGKWPYLGFDFEYPPLAYLLIAVPAWILDFFGMHSTENYRQLFGLLCILPFDVALFRAFRRRPPFAGAAFAYVLLTCALGLLLFDRFDLVVGFLIAWPFLTDAPRFGLAWGIGAATKLVPALLVPARFFAEKEGRTKLLLAGAAPLAASVALAAALGRGRVSFLSHHSGRGVQIESLLGNLALARQAFFGAGAFTVETNFGAQHLSDLPAFVTASRVVFVAALLATYAALAWRRRDTLVGAWLVLLTFVAFGYVLSPQFLLWLVPIGLCAAARVPPGPRRRFWLTLFGAATCLTGVHFRFYWDYANVHGGAVAVVLARNFLLVALWALSWRWMRSDAKLPA